MEESNILKQRQKRKKDKKTSYQQLPKRKQPPKSYLNKREQSKERSK